jgi:hypothetical protein
VKCWKYYLLEMGWRQADWPSAQIAAGPSTADSAIWRTISIAGYDLCFENQPDEPTFEVLRAADGRIVEVRSPDAVPGQTGHMEDVPASLPAIAWPKARTLSRKLDPNLSLFFRVADEKSIDLASALKVKARIVITESSGDGKPVTRSEELVLFNGLEARIKILKATVVQVGATPPANPPVFPATPFTGEDDEPPVLFELESPVDASGKVTRRSPFELFGEIKADVWSARAVEPDKPDGGKPEATAAFASLWRNLRSALPEFAWPAKDSAGQFVKPSYKDYQQVMGAYLAWSQRFLDHGAVAGEAPELPYALAAPIKAQPWHLAANSDGMLTLSFLHADRWAHARAYAVRPTPRYQNLALGAGYYDDKQDSERLVTGSLLDTNNKDKFKAAIGYALAVSPRTERIEPPVILGSRLTGEAADDKGGKVWELVVARHGEEALASSNRSLFARLGTEGTALTFAREYRDRNWPKRLGRATEQEDWPHDVVLYPTRLVGPLGRPSRDSEIDGKAFGEIADIYPSLWKGADIWRIDQLPPHYRVTALAVARAGLVVSNVVSAVQDETPRRELKDRDKVELLDHPAIVIKRAAVGAKSAIRVEGMRLISHADLTVEGAWPWIATDPSAANARKDIVWWPDPNVTYSLLRHGAVSGGSSLEEEDAEVQLVARRNPQADSDAADVPIAVRCRGPRFVPQNEAAEHPSGWPEVKTRESDKMFGAGPAKPGRDFHLAFSLVPRKDGLIEEQTARYVPKGDPDPAQQDIVRKDFNDQARPFALLRAEWQLTVKPEFDGLLDVAAVKQRFTDAGAVLTTAADALGALDDDVRLAKALRVVADNLKAESDAIPAAAPLPDLGRLSRERYAMLAWDDNVSLPPIVTPPWLTLAIGRTYAEILTVFDLPTQTEAKAVLTLNQHPFGKRGGALWRLCRERLFGAAEGFSIRAVDRRNAIDMPKQKPGAVGHQWVAVGEIDTEVEPPDWAAYVSEA